MTADAHPPLTLKAGCAWSLVALASFHAAQSLGLGWLLIPCAYALLELSRAPTNRKVFYPLLAVGFLFYAPQLGFFWGIFGAAAIPLWLVLGFWIALFGLSVRLVRVRFGNGWMLTLAPFLWTGIEYFRCELYYLRFGWMTFGLAHHANPGMAGVLGSFTAGFVCTAIAAALQFARHSRPRATYALLLALPAALSAAGQLLHPRPGTAERSIPVAGVQLEFPNDHQVLAALKQARARFPKTELFMLSEYTFQEPVPQSVRDWCASNRVYLVVGGKEPVGATDFYNMAYVVGTNGAIVHQQVKSVPIQFFKDGRPAPARKVWDSPWGKLGILTCYDLSYTRVVDDLVQQGAIALLNPTMDVADWGEQQHKLHARIAPMRAAEYGIPIFRVASSGFSQLTDGAGSVLASAPYPGEGEVLGGVLPLSPGRRPALPMHRWFGPLCAGMAALALFAGLIPLRRVPKAAGSSGPVPALSEPSSGAALLSSAESSQNSNP
jgi:apolipoprotein N-acyltransferase